MQWPSEAGEQVAATFDTGAGPGASAVHDGPWAIFRLLDASEVTAQSETRFVVGISAGGNNARLLLDATSIRNPFVKPALASFRCGA